MTENTDEKLTIAEQTLTYLLATDAAVRATDIARANAIALDEPAMRGMSAMFTRVVADFVIRMRDLEAMPSREEFNQALTEIATSVLRQHVAAPPMGIAN